MSTPNQKHRRCYCGRCKNIGPSPLRDQIATLRTRCEAAEAEVVRLNVAVLKLQSMAVGAERVAAASEARSERLEAGLKEIIDHLYLGNRGIDGANPSSVNWMRVRAHAALAEEDESGRCRVCGHPSSYHLSGRGECMEGNGSDDPREECMCPAFVHPSVMAQPSPRPSGEEP